MSFPANLFSPECFFFLVSLKFIESINKVVVEMSHEGKFEYPE